MRQGDPGECAYIIEKGRVDIIIEAPDGHKQPVGTRGPGAIIGEMALLDQAPRSATVIALEECELLEISQEDFSGRLEKADPILKMTTQVILVRYRDMLTRASIIGESRNWPPVELIEKKFTQDDTVEHIKIANEFQDAFGKGEISLHYQPIIQMKTGVITGFEALMRWEHPERGFISPNIFIPIAEESGLILEASRWALREGCKALHRIEGHVSYDHKLFMSVNFSSKDFASDDFVDGLYTITSESDIQADQIHIEITERLLMNQPENARETLQMCQKAGMSIAIDDFGTGYSSLSYLHYFPIDTLKIDRSFVSEMHKEENSMALIKSIIALGKNMKMKIIAEGVEELEEAQALRELGCDMAQGYYFARPLPEQEIIEFLLKSNPIAF